MEETMKSLRNKSAQKTRREKALLRLENQLKSGIKHTTDYDDKIGGYLTMDLSNHDKKRIEKEIAILKQRL